MEKNKSEFYGKNYLENNMRIGVDEYAPRMEDNGTFYSTAIMIKEILEEYNLRTILDVGCGRGFVVRHLRNLGYEAEGCEYGKETVELSVCNSIYVDLTEVLPYNDNSFDIVLCAGVLSHLPKENTENAIKELYRVTKKILITNILTIPSDDQWYHINVVPKTWWLPLFKKQGFIYNKDLTKKIIKEKSYSFKSQWFAIWGKF